MAKFLLIFLTGFFCQMFLFDVSAVSANTFRLNSIAVNGNNRISNAAIVNYSRLILNKQVSSGDLSTAYEKILNTGLFKDVSFKQVDRNLIITVEEYPTINEISFEGNKKFTDEKLSSYIETRSRYVFSPKALEADVAELQNVYRNSGRLSARINPKVIKLSDNRVDLIFEIYEGSIVEIEKINFVGNRNFSDRRLRRVLSSKQAGLFRKIISRDNLINEKISLDKKLLADFYKNRGFANFQINDVSSEL